VFGQQPLTATAQDKAQYECDENRVVKLAPNRDEIWNQVDWQRQVPEQENERDLARARDAIIGKQASKEDEAIGNETRDCPRFAATANGEQGEDDDRVEGEEHCKGNEREVGDRHRCQPIPGGRQSRGLGEEVRWGKKWGKKKVAGSNPAPAFVFLGAQTKGFKMAHGATPGAT